MPTFQRAPNEVGILAIRLIAAAEIHKPLNDCDVKIDYVFAHADVDPDTGKRLNNAITVRGMRALGVTRKIQLKDRAMGRGDAEIVLDGDEWAEMGEDQKLALLDHELTHIAVKLSKHGIVRDDLQRPVIKLRLHDFEFGWFTGVAARHVSASQEVRQARHIIEEAGQFYFPELCEKLDKMTISTGENSVTLPVSRFAQISKDYNKDMGIGKPKK